MTLPPAAATRASSAFASPWLLPMKASSASSPSASMALISALERFLLGPSSQMMGSASSAVLARHQLSATTATARSSTFTTFFTPGIFSTAAASKLTSVPPKTGQALIAAFSMPGSFRSAP